MDVSLLVLLQRLTETEVCFTRVLSAFEESSAACISDMLRQVSNGQYLDAIRMAEKFILHVEVLFAAIDDLEYHFARLNMKGMHTFCGDSSTHRLIHLQGCLMFGKRGCSVARPLIFSHSYRTHKRPVPDVWA